MSLANWILPSVSEQQVATWGVEVARGCQADVALRLGPAVRRMSLLEARGYIQARVAGVLDEQMELLQQTTGCGPTMASVVRSRAMDEVLRLAIGDLMKSTHQPLPMRQAA